jgi:hypothetical protein
MATWFCDAYYCCVRRSDKPLKGLANSFDMQHEKASFSNNLGFLMTQQY